ncbi:Uncharacterised protein [Chlamydia trachomatis]|nr:Uncharacterised protein [Chlamydia trachomatis]
MPFVHHFRVAGDQLNARLSCGFRHGRTNALHVIHRVALFKHKSARQVFHARAACGNIVDGAADGKLADVAAGEEMGRNHKRVGRKCKALVALRSRQNGCVIAFQQDFVAIRFKEHFVDNALHHRSARAMPQHYCFIHQKPPCEKRKLAIMYASNVKCYLILCCLRAYNLYYQGFAHVQPLRAMRTNQDIPRLQAVCSCSLTLASTNKVRTYIHAIICVHTLSKCRR